MNWRKSTRSGSQASCVEVGNESSSNSVTGWRKSTRSGSQAECVEVGAAVQVVRVRDTKDVTGPTLAFTSVAWRSFLDQL
jgi:hypothetical protein